MMKLISTKLVAFIVVFQILAMTVITASAQIDPAETVFPDVDVTTPYMDAIVYTEANGIVDGYSDGTFRPENVITRDQFTKILILTQYTQAEVDACLALPFPDVTYTNIFSGYICLAQQHGIINGYSDGLFHPTNKITVGEASKIISNTYGFTTVDDVSTDRDNLFEPYLKALGGVSAVPTTLDYIDQKINRGEMVEIIYRLEEELTTLPTKTYESLKLYEDSNLIEEINVDAMVAHLETPPAQSYVTISGSLPNPCYQIDHVEMYRDGFNYNIVVHSVAQTGSFCLQMIQDYEYTIDLNAHEIVAGTYTINVNGTVLNVVVNQI